jgi:zinc/manganese transport system substrate-binding protein
MKYYFSLLMTVGLLLSAPTYAKDTLTIFACEPEWAALAKEIGGSKVETFSATTAVQNPHYVRAKPSLLAAMRKADLVICSGACLEVGWLPILLQKAGRATIQPNSNGYLMAADFVPLLEKPKRLDRADGDIHPEGNPHIHLNPHNIALVAKELTERLKLIDPANTTIYQRQYDIFSQKWSEAIVRWEEDAKDLKNTAVVVHHKSFTYLLDWLGIKEADTLEPKPGVPATASHLESLLQHFNSHPAAFIIRTPYEPQEASEWLFNKTGMRALVLPYTVGGNTKSSDLFELYDNTIMLLTEANHAK